MKLGTCCICGTRNKVRNVVMLKGRCPTPGRGWGCIVCGLPADGAIAVLCDKCQDDLQDGKAQIKWICTGYPAQDGRTPLAEMLQVPFDHDLTKHETA